MKTLAFGIVLILLIGVAGFFYRNVMETEPTPEPVACTMDAKICPDGSSVGRVAPSCEFAACPASASTVNYPEHGIAFELPEGYVQGTQEPGGDGFVEGQINFYEKPAAGGVPHFISIYSYPIEAGQTGDEVILANTRYQPADMQAEDFERFETETIGGKTFRSTVIERFEAQVITSYFLVRANDVLRFDVMERDVTDWMEPTLSVKSLPEHAALREMLRTLQVSED